MNPNPFKPTAGKRPPILIGRESVIEDFEEGSITVPERRADSCSLQETAAVAKQFSCGSCNVWPASADGRLSPIPLRLVYATAWPTHSARISTL